MGICFSGSWEGMSFLQVKLFSFCKYPAVPPAAVQIHVSYLGGVELTPWEKRQMLLFLAFCYRLQDLLEIRPLGTVKTVHCQRCYLVYLYSQDIRVNHPSSRGETATKAVVVL